MPNKKKTILLILFFFSTKTIKAEAPLYITNCMMNSECLLNNYYFVTRLKNTIFLLYKIPKKIIKQLYYNELEESNNPTISLCINRIKKEKNLHQLFVCWHQIITYEIEADEFFFTEFAILICKILYFIKQITINTTKHKTETNAPSISQKIDQLPLIEILNTIDMLTNELPAFLEKYEFNSSMSWKAWIKKYWWIPPVIFFWFGLKILIKFQHKPNNFTFSYCPTQQPIPILTNDPALLEIIKTQTIY